MHCFQIYTKKKKKKKEIITNEKYSKQMKSLLVHLTNDSVKNTTEFVQLVCRVNNLTKKFTEKASRTPFAGRLGVEKKIAIIGVMGRCWKKKKERNLESLQGSNFLSFPPLFILSLPNECF